MPMIPKGRVEVDRGMEFDDRRLIKPRPKNVLDAPRIETDWDESVARRSYSIPSRSPERSHRTTQPPMLIEDGEPVKQPIRRIHSGALARNSKNDPFKAQRARVIAYAVEHPKARPIEIAEALGLERPYVGTVLKRHKRA